MKKHLFFILCLMALALNTLPAVANDYLTIHFKDGHTERHYLKLVESITTSKYDMEGKLHDDYQTQRLVISGETYSYPLLDIDSISYHKVDEEQVQKNVDNIYSTTAPIFEQCSTIEEMEGHIDEIKKMEGVEDVICSDRDIIVKVRDWHDIVFMYPVEPERQNSTFARGLESKIKTITRQIQNTKYDGTPLKVAIAHQMGNDSRFEDQRNDLIALKENILAMGLNVDFIPSEEGGNFDLDFYRRRMFDYDIVILDTHGCYDEDSNIHGFLTDEYLGVTTPEVKIWNWMNKYLDVLDLIDPLSTDIEDAFIGVCRTGYFSSGAFIGVTENFIAKSESRFAEGPHVVFNGACSSLKGDDVLKRSHGDNTKTYSGSDAVARIFHEKGADIYLGYNNTCTQSGLAAYNYVTALLSGRSHEAALNYIPSEQHDEQTDYKASLIDVINPNKTLFNFIVKTHTLEKSLDDIINEYTLDSKIEVFGSTLSMNQKLIQMGFEISTNSDFSDSKKMYDALFKQQENEGNGNILFKTNLTDLKPGKTYYYRAFTYDGIVFNNGETCSFTLPPAEAIDLGLPSGTHWASCNVGATRPEDYGGYYAWAETEEKSSYSWSNYKYSDATGDNMSKYCLSSYFGTVDGLTTIEPEDDAARVNMGKYWRIPTKMDMDELVEKCKWKLETLNGVKGYRVTGSNGNSIFLPFGGSKSDEDHYNRGSVGYYWVSTLSDSQYAPAIYLYSKKGYMDYARYMAQSIRPVLDKGE